MVRSWRRALASAAALSAACAPTSRLFIQGWGHPRPHSSTGVVALGAAAEPLPPPAPHLQEADTDARLPENPLRSWVVAALSFGAAVGLVAGAANALTSEEFDLLSAYQVRGTGLASRCPTVETEGSELKVGKGMKLKSLCFEPKFFAVEADTDDGKEFVTTKILTMLTYRLSDMSGPLTSGDRIQFQEEDGMDFAPTTVALPDGERVAFQFSMKGLKLKVDGGSFQEGMSMGGEFDVPSYRGGGFLDNKARGIYAGYDSTVGLPAGQAATNDPEDKLFKAATKVFENAKGAVEMEVDKVNTRLGEIGGVFVSQQPSDTALGSKFPRAVLIRGIFYGKVVDPAEA